MQLFKVFARDKYTGKMQAIGTRPTYEKAITLILNNIHLLMDEYVVTNVVSDGMRWRVDYTDSADMAATAVILIEE